MSTLLDEAVTGLGSTASDRRSRASLVTTSALILIAAQLGFRAWAVFGGWFYGDDLTFISDVSLGKGDLSWIFQKYDVQFMPIGLSLAVLAAKAGTFAWPVAATELIVFQAIASLACWWMLRTLFGNRAMILAPLTFYLFSAISMPALMWWAAGLNLIVVQPATFAAITFHVLHVRGGRRRYAVLATLALGIALLCYVKALLIPVVLLILTACYFWTGTPAQRTIAVLRRHLVLWISYAALGGVYLGLYLTHGHAGARANLPVDYTNLISHLAFSNLATGIVGGPWTWTWFGPGLGPRLMADPPSIAVTGALLAIIVAVAFAVSTFRGALKPFLFVIPYVVITIGILAVGRAGAFGAGVWSEIRYWTDFTPFLALAIGLMCLPLIGAKDPLTRRATPLVAVRAPAWLGPVLGAAFIASAIYSSASYVRPWHQMYETRQFITEATAELTAARVPVAIADQPVPDGVVNAFSFPYNLPSRFLAPLRQHFTTPDVGTDLRTFDGQGHVVPARVRGGIVAPAESFTTCVDGSAGGRSTTFALGARTVDFPFWLSIGYRATGPGSVALTAGSNQRVVDVSGGRHTLFVRTQGSYDAVTLRTVPGVTLCVDAIHVGPAVEPAQ